MEGFGIVYLEAATAGLCAVGSKSGGVAEAIIDGQTGLLAKEDDVSDTAEKIIKLLQNEPLRKRLAEQAQQRAKEEFSWPKRAVLFRGVVESVVK
jgi:phosphatidylinositol alpha-1,6-mannosyltransferase